MRIAIGADHAGFALKAELATWLAGRGLRCRDLGAACYQPGDDYPDYAVAVARAVASGEADLGLMICGTGVGSCIAANKVRGVRAAVCSEPLSASCSRRHNDANVLCLGARLLGAGPAKEIVAAWLDEPFSGEARHCRRLAKVSALEARPEGGE